MTDHSIIAIVDDNVSMRRLTARLLKRDGREAEGFASGDAFLADPAIDRFACVLLDLRMPGMDGIAVLDTLKERRYASPVLVITGHGDVQLAVEAMKLGAVNFLEKPFEEKDLSEAVNDAIVRHEDSSELELIARAADAGVHALPPRLRQVLCGVLTGDPNKIIAFQLGLSTRTVEGYRARLLEKLGVRSTVAAVRMAVAAELDCSDYCADRSGIGCGHVQHRPLSNRADS